MLVNHFHQGWFVSPREVLILRQLKVIEHLIGESLTLIEALGRVVRANDYHAEIGTFETDVNVEHEFFGAAGDADWGPSFSLLH